jgi:AraC-like DNA-binding protein
MHLLSATPDHRLTRFVHCFAQRETAAHWPLINQPITSSLEPSLSFDFCDRTVRTYPAGSSDFRPHIYLLGTQTRYVGSGTCLSGHVLSFGIFFRPFALWRLFGIPPAEVTNFDDEGTAVLGSWVPELYQKLGEAQTFYARIILATEALLRFVPGIRPLTSIMSTAHLLRPSDESVRIANVAHDSTMSIRNYRRQFAAEIGMSPKTFARVARFERAIDLKRTSENSWMDIAHDLGYFDQMHMIKDFRMLGGGTPGGLVHPDSDFQPWSVQAAFL